MKNTPHTRRIQQDLRAAGVTSYGLLKAEVRELPHILAEDEPVYGCIYGQYKGGSAMMVATDRRVIFLDKKPLHLLLEEMTYEKILDIGADWQPLYSKVVINARSEKYVFRYVNTKCARTFVRFLETAVLGMTSDATKRQVKNHHYTVQATKQFTDDESSFLATHYMAVISTIGQGGQPYGASMFYFPDEDGMTLRVVTRSETETAQNIRRNNKVALTITDEAAFATMHINGIASIDNSPEKGYAIVSGLFQDNPHVPKGALPPVAQIKDGAYVVIKIICGSSSLRIYKKTSS